MTVGADNRPAYASTLSDRRWFAQKSTCRCGRNWRARRTDGSALQPAVGPPALPGVEAGSRPERQAFGNAQSRCPAGRKPRSPRATAVHAGAPPLTHFHHPSEMRKPCGQNGLLFPGKGKVGGKLFRLDRLCRLFRLRGNDRPVGIAPEIGSRMPLTRS
jgi:hypothetical protein